MNEFWRIYRLVLTRRGLILGLMAAAVVTVLIAKKLADAQTQYLAVAQVLPSQKAMAAGGVYKDSGNGVLSPTYDRNSRLSQFTAGITNQQDAALDLAGRSVREQKQAVTQALSSHLTAQSRKSIVLPNGTVRPDVSDANLDAVLKLFNVPTDPALWAPRSITPEMRRQVRDGLTVAPYYETAVNATPGGDKLTPTMTDDIQIKVHASNPLFAQQIATLTAAAFVNSYYNSGKEEYSNSVSQLKEAQREAQQNVDTAQNALVDYEKKTGLVNLPAQTTAQVTDLQTLRQQRDTAQAQFSQFSASAAALKSQLAAAPQQNVTHLDPQSRPEVLALESKITSEQSSLEALASRYTSSNPLYIQAEAALQADRNALARLLRQPYIVSVPNPEYQQLRAQEHTTETQAVGAQATLGTLSAQIQALEASNSTTLPEAKKKLSSLQNKVDTALRNQTAAVNAYNGLVQTNKALDAGLITLTNAATYAVPDSSGPGLPALLVYATLLSLIMGIGIAVGLDSLDNRIQTVGDAEKLLGMSVSAVIPAMPPGDPRRMTRMIVSDPLSPVAEAYRLLRTDLLFTAEDKPFKSLMGATAKPGQGATTTICNLAVALAQVGKRVILIDADLRRPKLHDFFGVSNEVGLTNLLRQECELEEALKLTEIDNLLLLPSGPLPLNPSELLASARMRTLHERMKPHTDFILVDTPSAIAFSDSAILASFMDAVLLVMRAQEAPRGGEARVREMLTKARANVVGVVLNGVKPSLVDSVHYHAAYYPQIATGEMPQMGSGYALPAPPVGPSSAPSWAADALPDGYGHANGNGYTNGNGHANPYANGNGYIDGNGYEPTLMGVRLDHLYPVGAGPEAGESDAPPIHALTDGPPAQDGDASGTALVQAAPGVKTGKARFHWRSLFGTDDQN